MWYKCTVYSVHVRLCDLQSLYQSRYSFFFDCDSKNRTVTKSCIVSFSVPVDNSSAVFRTVGFFSTRSRLSTTRVRKCDDDNYYNIYACVERVVELSCSVPRQIVSILNYTHCTYYYAHRTLHVDAIYNNTSSRESVAAIIWLLVGFLGIYIRLQSDDVLLLIILKHG